ncbi:hypothetical protein BASA50_003226 [Batrachochytrium salamandrivorans]|uniref:Uncharacterized protein n=1 Tax=Batrachochytrium salamandrivorans TaxID=1357716 RepID=A0ABQ8FJE3_9FUNG|nr:hypothetical protein BASA62_008548 [Batrachochytrium salamandrivorans]KAH6599198.1 hypothetical protein BASA50_003226 [Batrachochytrium salamandrivorans]KAH6601844.1 hypothetical protein BASA61_001737 [Batrachochytrium salamandrivorans]KAH9269188.1 hypothetical protein BASA83_008810 [Batrachochytrium salamandrivorans]KAJ1342595.1 hypothetical protein BSLG_002693 [Batrachochytrium salamandrivorans]
MSFRQARAVRNLRDSIFNIDRASLGMRTGESVLAAPSMRQKLLHHYPPNIDLLALSAQDHRLRSLNLQDVWYEAQVVRETQLRARGKVVRVSVVTGVLKREEKDTKGKSKKRK